MRIDRPVEVRIASSRGDRASCMDLRRRVFIDEQGVPEAEEWDGQDEAALHLLAVVDGRPVGTARLRRLPGREAKAERVAVAADVRGAGIGRRLMERAIELAREAGDTTMVLGAQVAAIPFYERLGFTATGPVFDDAGIPHRHMHRSLEDDGLQGGRMTAETFELDRCDGEPMHCLRWLPDGTPRAVVQVAHGMQEHAARYEEVARALADAGYLVVADDHRGHGGSIRGPGQAGRLGKAGFGGVLCDLHTLSGAIRASGPDLPLFLLGHSWGSFLSQAYAQQWGGELRGLILTGSNGADPLVGPGVLLARLVVAIRGADRQAGLLETLSVGGLNKAFEPGATGKEWLSRDVDEVRRYVDDPLCGGAFPNSFFLELVRLLRATWAADAERRLPPALPVLMMTGTADPVSRGGKGVKALAARYRRLGLGDVREHYYEGARHELFHETNRGEVFRDLVAWLDAHV